jgi:methionyl-tRNA formyltransferase
MSARIIFFGTPDISVPVLSALHDAGFDIVAVVTQPDRTKGRNRKETLPPPVKVSALQLGLTVLQPETCKTASFIDLLASYKADAFCVFAFGQILPQRLLDLPRLGCFNAHASLLPHLRGAAPINWAIVRGDRVTGMTIQRMVFKLDAGPVCWRKEITIDERETAESLAQKMIPLAGEGLIATLHAALDGLLEPHEQDHDAATVAPLMKKDDGYIDWSQSAEEIDRKVRGFYPWPAASAGCDGEQIKLFNTRPVKMDLPVNAEPGEVLAVDGQHILVACGQDALAIYELQRQGKKRLDVCAYLCGCTIAPGSRFTAPPL